MKSVLAAVLAVLVFGAGLSAEGALFGESITVYDGHSAYAGPGWLGTVEDQEVEIGSQVQEFDYEMMALQDGLLTIVAGVDFTSTDRAYYYAGGSSGDLWIDLDGVRDQVSLPGFGYELVLDIDYTTLTYELYAAGTDLAVDVGWSRDGLAPWVGIPYRRASGGVLIGSGEVDVTTGVPDPVVSEYGLVGGVHHVLTIDLSFLAETPFYAHMTTRCRNDFLRGEGVVQLGRLGDLVWLDVNRDGLQQDDEPGIGGVTLTLEIDLEGDGAVDETRTTVTDATGYYLFDGLWVCTYPNAIYRVVVDDANFDSGGALEGLQPTLSLQGNDRALDSNGSPTETTLSCANREDLTLDFGYVEVPDDEGSEGCTPGFWKQPQHFCHWTRPYTPCTKFKSVFENAFGCRTLLDVLKLGGGGLNALGRHTVAALLNAANPNIDYGMTPQEVIAMFNAVYPGTDAEYEALKDIFAAMNERGCSDLGNGGDGRGDAGNGVGKKGGKKK